VQTNQASRHSDLFYRGSVPKNLVPVEEATKVGSISTLSLSLKQSLRPSEPSLNHTGVGAKAKTKTLPFAPAFVCLAAPTEAEEPARSTLRLVYYEMKAYDGVPPSHVLTRPGGPHGLRPSVTGPARRSVLRAQFAIAFL
jgi:hypothetical protein